MSTLKVLPINAKDALSPQEIIDLFKISFKHELYESDLEDLKETIQAIKGYLYEREYLSAFDSEIKRIAYCCRWSPSRGISYSSLFSFIKPICNILKGFGMKENGESLEEGIECLDINDNNKNTNNILCIGGGAGGELVAIASIFTLSRDFNSKYYKTKDNKSTSSSINLKLVDIADWSSVVNTLTKEINKNWLRDFSSDFKVEFENRDILNISELGLNKMDLITLLFTTNELFNEDKAGSIRFFQKLNAECHKNAYLLIAESAGSYSHITVGSKKFPLQFLIDTLLLGKRKTDGDWELVDENDSIWYRCNEELDYPLKIENMRFFYRLYKKK
ncbi:25S rRNA (uracil2843-N3)-methyltransferase SCDLUD_000646 [Saccharomycodes ludwigii]|uniref:25S rRNA (uracil2843-N3)-methyltransferase n=1 Tax=Saccharomycodes ludwigii TaxID=36035 RepID=UPI001E8BA4DA|nr:hypothetical protein SCDLUD_000646 [Saccharomycodes ludwigii]KAH3903036.1 hypothetical protein SCDLUD_000646 [Saccharomycodes ludwigii]